MEKILKEYEETIEKLEIRIEQLKDEKKTEHNLDKLHKLEWRIELLKNERIDMIKVCHQIRAYMAPKTASPSIA